MRARTRIPESMFGLLVVLIFAGNMFMSGCSTPISPTPVRSFSTMDLLINLSDMPGGWRVSENSPSRILDYLTGREPDTADDASGILFLAEPHQTWYEAAHNVYRFKTFSTSKHVYESQTLGETPLDWNYQSSTAEESKLLCRQLGQPDLIYCTWFAYYDEYYVEFAAALIPGKMSLDGVERIAKIIDTKMAQHLDTP